MHTKGILVMTPDSAMVLTGKQAIEYSGAWPPRTISASSSRWWTGIPSQYDPP